MIKKISELTEADKVLFLEKTKQAMLEEYGIPWEFIEARFIEEIENTFDDEKFLKMDADARIDAAYARKEFGDQKPELVDYLLWQAKFVVKADYVEL